MFGPWNALHICLFHSQVVRNVNNYLPEVRGEAAVHPCLGHLKRGRRKLGQPCLSLLLLACKYVIMSVCSWTSGRRVLEGPAVCVNPLKASGSLLLWRFQWIFATA